MTHEPVIWLAEPEPELELDSKQETEEKTSSEVSTLDVLPQDGKSTTTAPSGLDLFSFWLIFLRFFSIAFLTACFPPDAAMASYRALFSRSFFSAVAIRQL